ncbi:hypothetical protein FQZ97_1077040 [compost metagenome]
MVAGQSRLLDHVDAESAVVGAQRFGGGQVAQRQDGIGRRFARVAGRLRRRADRGLHLYRGGWRQVHRFGVHAGRRFVGEHRLAVGIGVLVDLRAGWQHEGEQRDGNRQAHGQSPLVPASLAPPWAPGKRVIVDECCGECCAPLLASSPYAKHPGGRTS